MNTRINAIQSKHTKYADKKSLRADPGLKRFLKGSFVRYTPVKDRVPSWDLPLVLDVMKRSPFEPIESMFWTFYRLRLCFGWQFAPLTGLVRCKVLIAAWLFVLWAKEE